MIMKFTQGERMGPIKRKWRPGSFFFPDAHNLFLSHVDLSLDFDTSLITLSVEHKSPNLPIF